MKIVIGEDWTEIAIPDGFFVITIVADGPFDYANEKEKEADTPRERARDAITDSIASPCVVYVRASKDTVTAFANWRV